MSTIAMTALDELDLSVIEQRSLDYLESCPAFLGALARACAAEYQRRTGGPAFEGFEIPPAIVGLDLVEAILQTFVCIRGCALAERTAAHAFHLAVGAELVRRATGRTLADN